jgi:hypothetical protein
MGWVEGGMYTVMRLSIRLVHLSYEQSVRLGKPAQTLRIHAAKYNREDDKTGTSSMGRYVSFLSLVTVGIIVSIFHKLQNCNTKSKTPRSKHLAKFLVVKCKVIP